MYAVFMPKPPNHPLTNFKNDQIKKKVSTEAEFKEFEPQLKFKPGLKYG